LCAGLGGESGYGQAGQRPDETKFHWIPLDRVMESLGLPGGSVARSGA